MALHRRDMDGRWVLSVGVGVVLAAVMALRMGIALPASAPVAPAADPAAPALSSPGVPAAVVAGDDAPSGCEHDVGDEEDLLVVAGLDQCGVVAGTVAERRLVVEVRPGTDEAAEQPVTMLVVLDRSGSMSGEKLEEAKAATSSLAASLRPTDRFGLVTFGSSASLVLAPAPVPSQEELDAVLRSVVIDGGTRIAAGVDLALAALDRAPAFDGVTRMVVLSDGQDGGLPGEVHRLGNALAGRDVAASTAGLGTGADDVTLGRLAVEGGGTYAFLAHPADIVPAFAEQLDAARRVAVRGVEVVVPLGAQLRVDEVYLRQGRFTEEGLVVRLGDLPAGGARKVVARVSWDGRDDRPDPVILVRGRTVDGGALEQRVPLRVHRAADAAGLAALTDPVLSPLAASTESYVWFERASLAYRQGNTALGDQTVQAGKAAVMRASDGKDVGALRQFSDGLSNLAEGAADLLFGEGLQSNFGEIQTRVNAAI